MVPGSPEVDNQAGGPAWRPEELSTDIVGAGCVVQLLKDEPLFTRPTKNWRSREAFHWKGTFAGLKTWGSM